MRIKLQWPIVIERKPRCEPIVCSTCGRHESYALRCDVRMAVAALEYQKRIIELLSASREREKLAA